MSADAPGVLPRILQQGDLSPLVPSHRHRLSRVRRSRHPRLRPVASALVKARVSPVLAQALLSLHRVVQTLSPLEAVVIMASTSPRELIPHHQTLSRPALSTRLRRSPHLPVSTSTGREASRRLRRLLSPLAVNRLQPLPVQ